MLEINIGGTLLIGTYPGTNQWFELKITGDLSSSIWGIYVNGVYQGELLLLMEIILLLLTLNLNWVMSITLMMLNGM